jgi:hypothetical protein
MRRESANEHNYISSGDDWYQDSLVEDGRRRQEESTKEEWDGASDF